MTAPTPVQATVVARRHSGVWRGVALTGPPGVGKTGTALQLMAAGWRLVADDGALIWASGGSLWARAPRPTATWIEARGLGLVSVAHQDLCRLELAVRLTLEEPERMPDPTFETWSGLPLRTLALHARATAAAPLVAMAFAEAVRRPVSP